MSDGPFIVCEFNAGKLASIRKMLDGRVARAGASKGVRRSLSMLEEYHKKVEMKRGVETGGGRFASAIADPTRISVRTGALSRSYRISMKAGALVGAYGSDLDRARLLETGGVVRPVNGRMLAIPSAYARTGRGAALWPSQQPPGMLFRVGNVLYKKGNRISKKGGLPGIPMYYLTPQVRIKARPSLQNTMRARSAEVLDIIGNDIVAEIKGASNDAKL